MSNITKDLRIAVQERERLSEKKPAPWEQRAIWEREWVEFHRADLNGPVGEQEELWRVRLEWLRNFA